MTLKGLLCLVLGHDWPKSAWLYRHPALVIPMCARCGRLWS